MRLTRSCENATVLSGSFLHAEDPWLSLREDEIERANCTRGIYGVVDKHDCAAILPIDGDHIWLVEQYRYTIRERALELPQGGWESEIDNPEELARGELREKTGLLAGRMTELPWMWIAYGFGRQREHIFVAEELTLARTIATTKKPTWRSCTSPSRTSKRNSAPARSAMSAPLPPGVATSSGFTTSAEPRPRKIQKTPADS
jgi:hypothetical protein